MYDSFSVLIGGRAGDGVNEAGNLLGRLISRLGYRIYAEVDYPSLIRGGHNFCVVRASAQAIGARTDALDVVLALTAETVDRHRARLRSGGTLVVDAANVKDVPRGADVVAVDVVTLLKEEGAPQVMRNTCLLGAFARVAGIPWETVEDTVRKHTPREQELNLRVARRGYQAAEQRRVLPSLGRAPQAVINGNEAIGLGLARGGLEAFIAYPMTPVTGLLHFMAHYAEDFGFTVVQPESELAVMLMSLGMAYAGRRVAVCTSGGGFCLMTEGFSLSGAAELPVTVVLGQRPGPSTGLPTYTSQSELHFALHAGQGEFPRVIVAPATPLEAYEWSPAVLGLSWKYQVPGVILVDKTLCEGSFSTDAGEAMSLPVYEVAAWDGASPYKRYARTDTGVSPLAFPPLPGEAVKVDSYEHDEAGLTTEDAAETVAMQEKRLGKLVQLEHEIELLPAVKVTGPAEAITALLCWGSNGPVCEEVAAGLGLKVIRPRVLWPFPAVQMERALRGVQRTVCVEGNATGQLLSLLRLQGLDADDALRKYDGRPFSVEDLEAGLAEVLS